MEPASRGRIESPTKIVKPKIIDQSEETSPIKLENTYLEAPKYSDIPKLDLGPTDPGKTKMTPRLAGMMEDYPDIADRGEIEDDVSAPISARKTGRHEVERQQTMRSEASDITGITNASQVSKVE